MKNLLFLVGMIFLLLPWLLGGCGVAQEQYDAVVADLSNAQQELQSVKAEVGTTQAKVSELTSSLEKANTELETSQTKVSELTSSLEKAQTELGATEAKNSELTSSLDESRSENQALEQANDKLKRLTFLKTALCSEKPEPWKPKPKPDNSFDTNDTVYVYAEFTGWKYILVGQELHRDIAVSLNILDANGKVAGNKAWTVIDKHDRGRPSSRRGFDKAFGPLEAGKYTVELKITDNNAGETITWKEEFQVVSR